MENYDDDINSIISDDSDMNESKPKKPRNVDSSDDEYDENEKIGGLGGEGFDEDEDVDVDIDGEDEDDTDNDELDDLEENNMKALRDANIIDTNELQTRRFEDTDEEDEDEDDKEDYLQKLNENHKKKIIQDYHPELKSLNYEEIEALCTVVRDADGNIIDPLHKTIPILSRYERARVLGERADQINSGAQPFIEVEPTMIDGYLIALKELEQKKIPFIIQRPLPNGTSEYWRLRDLEQL
jgi:DNA-directed RNA polymerase I, II, and III subunit RPABC2